MELGTSTEVGAPEPNPEGLGGTSVGRCLSPCAQDLGYAAQCVCHVEGTHLEDHELELLLDHWELEPPNLILEVLGPVQPHPTRMITKEMLAHSDIHPFVKELRDMLGVLGDEAEDDEKITEALGERLYEKLIQCTIALLRACEQTNSWIVFQDGPQITIPLVRDALSRCDARPVILVCENCSYYSETDVLGRILEFKTPLALVGHSRSQPLQTIMIYDGWSQEYPVSADSITDYDVAKHPCSFATHYIFSRSWHPISFSKLAPKGTFYIAGGHGCAGVMMGNAAKYQPSVYMLHTGRACDVFGSAIDAIKSEDCKTTDAVIARMKERLPFAADEPGRCFGNFCDSNDAYRWVSSLLSAHDANPREFKAVNVVLNTWAATPEEVLNKLSRCFGAATAGGASLEVGAAEAKEESVRAAWKIHRTLHHNCGIFKRSADYMTVTGALLSLATTIISVTAVALEMRGSRGERTEVLRLLTILLPAVGGVVVTALSRFRYLSKWGSMHVAMMEIESEIWKFRASGGEYDTLALHEEDSSKKRKKKAQGPAKKQGSNAARRLFTSRVSQTFSGLMGGEMHVDSLEPDESTPLLEVGTLTQAGEQRDYVDDHVSDLSGEGYFAHRLMPQLDAFRRQAPLLSRRLTAYEILVLVSTLVTTLLATLQVKVWIPVAVAFSTMFTAFLQYEALQPRLAAVNGAIADLTRFSTDWAAMGVLERRGRLVKALMVQLTEGAVLRVATAYAGGAAAGRPSADAAKGKDEEEKGKGKEE